MLPCPLSPQLPPLSLLRPWRLPFSLANHPSLRLRLPLSRPAMLVMWLSVADAAVSVVAAIAAAAAAAGAAAIVTSADAASVADVVGTCAADAAHVAAAAAGALFGRFLCRERRSGVGRCS